MTEKGWRIVVVDHGSRLSCSNGTMMIEQHDGSHVMIPIPQLQACLIQSSQCSITVPLLNALIEHHVSVIFCDKNHTPSCQVIGLNHHFHAAGHLMDQCTWKENRKQSVWKNIVENKIKNQITLLSMTNRPFSKVLLHLQNSVVPGDKNQCEGQAARIYFSALYGHGFHRHSFDNKNIALNYGYTILRTAIDRILVSHGYHTALGIHHCNRSNPYNLSCDLMEPFRPFVDHLVYETGEKVLDRVYKEKLISILHKIIYFGGNQMQIQTALEVFSLDVLYAMEDSSHSIKEVSFDG